MATKYMDAELVGKRMSSRVRKNAAGKAFSLPLHYLV